ncbi:sensor histidine kinase [Streptomyces triticagri]|uniref:histidine kinase n=1 Tax=Streptomyces triticagri TaxID=2293568 RepID=A0A372M726_9ACTN|nr:HAMP domain-containing sensor histidine kinase [Streptomyces triticagri]RFU86758.1 sensor histidine kinase [Streptomyces triticagri]
MTVTSLEALGALEAPDSRAVPALPDPDSPSMAAVAAHQVRGPLSSVRLRLELLGDRLDGDGDQDARREVGGVLREVQRLADVLEQVLAWGAVEQGGAAPVEAVDVLGSAAARVDAWSVPAQARGVQLRLDGIAVTGTQARGTLEQVLDVLIDNALHASPEGGTVHIAVQPAAGADVCVEVRDEGPGMSDEEISRARRPFWRGPGSGGSKGTGLGLTIASALLTASDGRLELHRAPGGGLRAVAVLPQHAD